MRVCSRKREDPMTRKRHRESRDLQSREEVKGSLVGIAIAAGTLAYLLAWAAVPVVAKAFAAATRPPAGFIGSPAPDAHAISPWLASTAAAVIALMVAITVGVNSIAKQLDDIKLKIHLAMYRDIIEAHARAEAS